MMILLSSMYGSWHRVSRRIEGATRDLDLTNAATEHCKSYEHNRKSRNASIVIEFSVLQSVRPLAWDREAKEKLDSR